MHLAYYVCIWQFSCLINLSEIPRFSQVVSVLSGLFVRDVVPLKKGERTSLLDNKERGGIVIHSVVVVYLSIPCRPCSSLVGCTKFNSAQPQIDRILSDLTIEILQLPPTLPLGYCGHYTGFPIPRSPVQLSVIHSFIHPATLFPTLISPSAFNVSGDEHLLTNWQFCDIVGFVLLWPASLKKCSSSGRTQDYVCLSLWRWRTELDGGNGMGLNVGDMLCHFILPPFPNQPQSTL